MRCAVLTGLITLAAGTAQADGMRPVQDWPLGVCAADPVTSRICLNAPEIWTRFGHGAPEVETAVIETFETFAMGQIMAQHPFLQHIDIPQFWHAQETEEKAEPRPELFKIPEPLSERAIPMIQYCKDIVKNKPNRPLPDSCKQLNENLSDAALAFADWRDLSQHELKMIGLIAGQNAGTLRRTGIAPLGAVSLHYIETTPSKIGLNSLTRRLNRRPAARVVNFSNEGPEDEILDLQYARIYRVALTLNAGRRGQSGDNPDDRLLVASSANTIGRAEQNRSYPSPNPVLPPEASLGPPKPQFRTRHDPVIAHVLPAPDVPVLVVSSIASDGKVAEASRVEPMIHIYAPGGASAELRVRSRREAAELSYDSVTALQDCGTAPAEAATDAVPTLDWGPSTDIRASDFIAATQDDWNAAGPAAMFTPSGCLNKLDAKDGIFLNRIVGNSVSTALVSGVAAQMFALDPQISAAEVRDILVDTARANRVNGLPVLDAVAALETVLERYAMRMARDRFGAVALLPDSLQSSSIAPGLFGQIAWREITDDPPLELTFTATSANRRGLCRLYDAKAMTRVERQGDVTARVAVTFETKQRVEPCADS